MLCTCMGRSCPALRHDRHRALTHASVAPSLYAPICALHSACCAQRPVLFLLTNFSRDRCRLRS
jgi:hypothetical protein